MNREEVLRKTEEALNGMKSGLKQARDTFAYEIKEDWDAATQIAADQYNRNRYRVIAAYVILLLALSLIFCAAVRTEPGVKAYVAGTSPRVPIWMSAVDVLGQSIDRSGQASQGSYQLVRGSSVMRFDDKIKIGGVSYVKVKDAAAPFRMAERTLKRGSEMPAPCPEYQYIREDSITDDISDVVRETEIWARTPVTVYAEAEGPAIASFAKKGFCLKVIGHDGMNSDGTVNKYKVEYTGEDGLPKEGYVYAKYMTDSQEKADAVYNENGIYDRVSADNYDMKLYGGKASHLDYYPYERPVIEGNEFCENARAMYLNCAAGTHPKKYIKIINDTDCNAVVVDIKDGVLAYKSEVAKELSPRSYKTAYASVEEYREGINALKETGAYLIGRIVVFNDPIYAKDHPEECIIWGENTGWPSAYSRTVWEYNVRLAQEAVREFGFNEIQFDYVRFPENSYEMSKSRLADFRNKYGEEKGQAVQNFCFYAADQIHEAGAYFSVDVFGESAYGYMTAYGQYWPGISNIVDAISAMPYTDHMGGDEAWADPYGTMKNWSKKAASKQSYLEHPAAARTWITGYNTPHWNPVMDYGASELKAQVRALYEEGLTGGFIPWNALNDLGKYRQYKSVWNIE